MIKIACDRCGTIFNPYEEITYNDNSWRLSVYYDHHPYPEEKMDLCPNCQKELLKWLGMKVKKEVGIRL